MTRHELDLAQVDTLGGAIREAVGESAAPIYADQGYTGEVSFDEVAGHEIILQVVKRPGRRRGSC